MSIQQKQFSRFIKIDNVRTRQQLDIKNYKFRLYVTV